jgi:phage FluMu protein Com
MNIQCPICGGYTYFRAGARLSTKREIKCSQCKTILNLKGKRGRPKKL